MSRVTVIRTPTVFSKHSYSVPVVPPLGPAYLAAALREAGHDVQLLDAVGEDIAHAAATSRPTLWYQGLSIPDIVARVRPGTRLLAVSSMFSQEWPHVDELIAALAEAFPDVPIAVGGEHATAAWDYILDTAPAVRCVGLGEGERTLCELAEWADSGDDLSDIPGIAYRRDGRAVLTAPRPRVSDITSLPRPAWDLVPLAAYWEGGFGGHGIDRGRSMPLLATRGCPFQCTFCSNPAMWTTKYAMRDVSDVVDEIEAYLRRYGATNIDFYDLTAIIRKDWILAFCAEVRRRNLRFTWQLPSGTRSEALDEEVLAAIFEAGCRNVTYAPESGSERTLREIKKAVQLPRMVASLTAAKRLGLSVKCNLVIGFPKDTRLDLVKTLGFALRLAWMGIDDLPLYVFSPYPGSELFRYLQSTGRIPRMDHDYFESLVCFMDLSAGSSYCERVGPREINAYRVLGMAACYAVGYLRRPWRIMRTLRSLRRHTPETVLEQRLIDLARRTAQMRAEAG